MNIRLSERSLETKFGTFTEVRYYDGQKESIALVMGDVGDGEDVFCRVHSHCIGAHVFNSVECTCREEMEGAQAAMNKIQFLKNVSIMGGMLMVAAFGPGRYSLDKG